MVFFSVPWTRLFGVNRRYGERHHRRGISSKERWPAASVFWFRLSGHGIEVIAFIISSFQQSLGSGSFFSTGHRFDDTVMRIVMVRSCWVAAKVKHQWY